MWPNLPDRRAALLVAALMAASASAGQPGAAPSRGPDLSMTYVANPAAFIPPQCYTRTENAEGRVHNPCFTCHQASRRPNYVDDGDLQLAYAFPGPALTNRWSNLFRDRSSAIAAVADDEVLDYVRTDNYHAPDGEPVLRGRLARPPASWDMDGDGRWGGYVPDAYFRFDDEGFDRTPDGGYTGWRAFAYYPFPGTFWPTNGSTGDVLVRLPQAFRTDEEGRPDLEVYRANLAIVEALVKEADVLLEPVDEARLGNVDLDRSGSIGRAERVVYDWNPRQGREMTLVGAARRLQAEAAVHLAAGLFPEGTEFLHTVRYIDLGEDGVPRLAPRMKEVRYARKTGWLTYSRLHEMALDEIKEADAFPDRLELVHGDPERGVWNRKGWMYQGFIEDARGELRPQSLEEHAYCVGCHGGVGANTDGVFAFARKLGTDGHRRGWYHWSQRGLVGLAEPLRADGRPEYAHYLEQNGAGDEFRENDEVRSRFFDEQGQLRAELLERLRSDVSVLLNPSPGRALALNKAYLQVVREQSYALGREPVLRPTGNVHREVKPDQPTGITRAIAGPREP